jgi:hypothetical protein
MAKALVQSRPSVSLKPDARKWGGVVTLEMSTSMATQWAKLLPDDVVFGSHDVQTR